MKPFNHLDLFSGIGMFAYAASFAGFKTVLFCEIEPFCQQVLKKNFPGVPIHADVQILTVDIIRQRAGTDRIDLLTAGFPCQGISIANPYAKGLEDERSGLWKEVARLISDLRPRFAILENSAVLPVRGLSRIVGDLAEIGYDAEWEVVSAYEQGACHNRQRLCLVCYPNSESMRETHRESSPFCLGGDSRGVDSSEHWATLPQNDWAARPSEFLRMDDGSPYRVDRSRALGNSIVPQCFYPVIARIGEVLSSE